MIPDATGIHVITLGSLGLRGDLHRREAKLVRQPKPMALLVYLAHCGLEARVRRDTLVGLLWGERPDRPARRALSQALYVVRGALGQDVITSHGRDALRVQPEALSIDTRVFEGLLDEGRREAALELYGGDFLDGFYISSAPSFERWVTSVRRELARRAGEAAHELSRRYEREGDDERALRYALRALDITPFDETALRVALEIERRLRGHAAALQTYDVFRKRIAAEFDAEPTAATRALAEQIRFGESREDPVPPPLRSAATVPEPEVRTRTGDLSARPERSAGPVGDATTPRRPRRKWMVSSVAVLAMLAFAVRLDSPTIPFDRTSLHDDRVAVLEFENRTGREERAILALLAGDWINRGVAQVGVARVLSAPVRIPADVPDEAAQSGVEVHRNALIEVARATGARWIISGTIAEEPGVGLGIWCAVSDLREDRTAGFIGPVRVDPASPAEGLEELEQRVKGLIAAELAPGIDLDLGHRESPPLYAAYRLYRRGIEAPTVSDRYELFLAASRLDTSFIVPLIEALGALRSRFPEQPAHIRRVADSIVTVLESRGEFLTDADRHRIAAYRAFHRGDQEGRYRALRLAAELSPDQLWDLHVAALATGRWTEVVDILREEGFPRAWRNYPWKSLTVALHHLGRHEEELSFARDSRADIQETLPRAPYYVGRLQSYEMEAIALAALGRWKELDRVLEEAMTVPREAMDTDDPAARMVAISGVAERLFATAGIAAIWHGASERAPAYLETGVEHMTRLLESPQPVPDEIRLLLGRALLYLGRSEEAVAQFEHIPELPPNIWLGEYGIALRGAGHSERADAVEERAGAALESGRPNIALAMMRGALGECDEAVRLVAQAVRNGLGRHWLHMRIGLHRCKDHPGFKALTHSRG